MPILSLHSLRTLAIGGVGSFAVAAALLHLHADVPLAPTPLSTPLLQQLSGETQNLYQQSRRSMVRVQLPTPEWLATYNARQNLLNKWGSQLNAKAREQILEDQEKAMNALHNPSTQASSRTSTRPASSQPFSVSIHVTDAIPNSQTPVLLFAIGLVVDHDGHAVFPVCVDRKLLGDTAWPAVTGDGELTTAKFVGCDAKTNLTVMQLEKHTGDPAALGHGKPEDGSLTLVIAPDGSAKLVVWNNQRPEQGFAILTDGAMAGFGFDGYFLGASQAKPVVDQLISTGEVHRAILGVLTQEVGKEDPLRHQRPQLGSSPAIRIIKVQTGSAADQGGIQVDDLILKIGDEVVGDAPTFAAVIASKRGDTILHILRGTQLMDLTVNLQPK
jgi:hypothetical protein